MFRWLSPGALAGAYRDPVSWAILAVDLFPVYALVALGWDAAALVFLYWLENVIIGGATLLRMTTASTSGGLAGSAVMLFAGPFFVFHYGMFCFVHGIFLVVFSQMSSGASDIAFLSPWGLIDYALGSGDRMAMFAGVIIALQLFLFLRDFIGRGEWKQSNFQIEMMKPYGRIIVLHVSLFAGFALMIAIGQPFLGVLGLILLRALWGVYLSVRRHLQLEGKLAMKVDEVSLF